MEDDIVKKVGGRFKLASLIQKRMIALNAGARPLVAEDPNDRMAVVLAEIKQDKIFLDSSGVLVTVDGSTEEVDMEEDSD
jgi:DNA-directed RNA polymerase subunit omega